MQMLEQTGDTHIDELREVQGDERDTLLQTIAEALTVYGVCVDEMLYEHLTAEWDEKNNG